ncbi:hypothetical protein MM326_17915 [Alkalihalobacillus sp. LMS6]|uniref:hypothetical protein n=1 Tax=Alkalihalobacillus sp. LMS6 TaxID=2924034 RepID=UPI0020D1D8A5|nr:hypothetical protein [Alkalihalobacillus sp. LMS6]UTR05929.1 hypothetical protein MM326_17915 [Alkalihalobacillus sp. LMS6]
MSNEVTKMINKMEVEDFFKLYEKQLNEVLAGEKSVTQFADFYADAFIGTDSAQMKVAKNDQTLVDMIHANFDYYRSIGAKKMIATAVSVQELDDYHALAKVEWEGVYMKAEQGSHVSFAVQYLVKQQEANLVIFGSITGDETST